MRLVDSWHWRHDGIDEIVVLGGDFKPNQRLMAYNLSDGAERWWVGGLPPSGKSTSHWRWSAVSGRAGHYSGDGRPERKDPDRAAQFYEKNAARVMAVSPGTKVKSASEYRLVREKGVPGVPSPLYYNGRLYTFQNGGIVFCRVARTGELLYTARLGAPGYYYFASGCRPEGHCIRRGRGGGAGCR